MFQTEKPSKPDWDAMLAAASSEHPDEEFDIATEIAKADENMPANDNQTLLFSAWLDGLDPHLRAELANEAETFYLVKEAFRQGVRLSRPPDSQPFTVLISLLKKQLARNQEIIKKLSSAGFSDLEERGDDTFYEPSSGKILNHKLAESEIIKLTKQIKIVEDFSQRFNTH